MKKTETFLRWAGSKRQLLPRLMTYWPGKSCRYVEPFAGSASFFFRVEPKIAVLGDINYDLINTYRAVRERHAAVASALTNLAVDRETYYRLRQIPPKTMSSVAAAARFIYLNRFCFNGLYRTNTTGLFNVPFAPSGTGSLPTPDHLARCAALLRRADLVCSDFEETLKAVRPGDFVYLDPPFAVDARRVFREYSASTFINKDLDRLCSQLHRIDAMEARFVVSYADCSEARRAFRAWHMKRVRTRRNIAGFAQHRRHAYEIIATNIREDTQ